jgi:pimeloyl-ACP methyl ester carboxylesterase
VTLPKQKAGGRTVKIRLFAAMLFSLLWSQPTAAQEEASNVIAYERIKPAEVSAVRAPCDIDQCGDAHAVVFIHGIFGNADTFRNGVFNWPREIPAQINGKRVDVYQVEYQTQLLAWLKKDISNLDEVVYAVFGGMRRQVLSKGYKSIGLIGHSLGGNVATSYLHTVKTELGHDARARHSFVLTLGTPTDGAEIASLGLYLKSWLGMRDPLLTSLVRDNTFLRMLAHWRYSEDIKATTFNCRPVRMYAGLEGASLHGVKIVSESTARFMEENYSPFKVEYRTFPELNHSSISKPSGTLHDVYLWVNETMKIEFGRADTDTWAGPGHEPRKLCRSIY